jgi:hypothetical protein
MKNKWKPLLKIATYSLWLILFFVLVQILVYIFNPPPKDVVGFFNLYQKNAILGLLSLDLIMLIDWILEIPIFLALYVLLKRKNESLILLATVLAMIGIAIYFASGIAFEMLLLSNQYALATSEIQKTILLSAGQSLLVSYQGTAFNISYVLVAIAFLIDSIVMLKSKIFTKKTAYFGIAMGILMLLPPTAGIVGFVCSFLSLIPMLIWFVLVAKKFSQLTQQQRIL